MQQQRYVVGWRGVYYLRVLAGSLIAVQVISISAFDVAPEYGNFKPSVLKVMMMLLLLLLMMMGLLLLLLLLQSLITPPPSALRSPSPKPPAATTSTSTPNGPL